MSDTKKYRNPYIIGRPIDEPELFFGRESLFQFIEDSLQQGNQVILLHGQRRIGKSSVLKQIPNFVKLDNFVFVAFDLQDKSQLSLSKILYSLATEIANDLEIDPKIAPIPAAEDLEENPNLFAELFLPAVDRALGGKNLVLLLDEFDVLSDPSSEIAVNRFFPYLRSLLKQQSKLFIIPVVGRQLDDLPNLLSLFRQAPNQEISLLQRQNAEKLILEPAKGILEYESEAIDAILELSAGHPYFTQVLCFALFSKAREEDCWKVTRTDVEVIVDRAIEIGEAGLTWFRDGIPIPERVVFSAIARLPEEENERQPLQFLEDYGVVLTNSLNQASEKLSKYGFVILSQSGRLKVAIELVRRWSIKRYSIQSVIQELEKIDLQIEHIYQNASQLYKNGNFQEAESLYEKIFNANPNHFNTIFKLAKIHEGTDKSKLSFSFYSRAYQFDRERMEEQYVKITKVYLKRLITSAKFEEAIDTSEKFLRTYKEKRIGDFDFILKRLDLLSLLLKNRSKSISEIPRRVRIDKRIYLRNNYELFHLLKETFDFTNKEMDICKAQYNAWLNYQKKLERYTQELLQANYRESPITPETRSYLYLLQQELKIGDRDAKKIRQRFTTELEDKIDKAKEIYRAEFQSFVQEKKNISSIARAIMNVRKKELGLLDQEVKKIEYELLKTYQKKESDLKIYFNVLKEVMKNDYYPCKQKTRDELILLQKKLLVSEKEAISIENHLKTTLIPQVKSELNLQIIEFQIKTKNQNSSLEKLEQELNKNHDFYLSIRRAIGLSNCKTVQEIFEQSNLGISMEMLKKIERGIVKFPPS